MSSYGTKEEIANKIREAVLKTVEKDSTKNALWVHFDDITDLNI